MGLFDPKGINKKNVANISQLQDERAAGTLGMSDGQKDALVSRGQEQVGASTQALLSQMPSGGQDAASQQRFFQGAVGGMQGALAQQNQGADMASEQQAANKTAELESQEQALFQRRKDKRDFFGKTIPEGIGAIAKGLGGGAGIAALCWVAVVLWGEGDERTLNARLWVNTHDNWFTRLYRARGQGWAAMLRRHPSLKVVAWPIWRTLALLGESMLVEGKGEVNDG